MTRLPDDQRWRVVCSKDMPGRFLVQPAGHDQPLGVPFPSVGMAFAFAWGGVEGQRMRRKSIEDLLNGGVCTGFRPDYSLIETVIDESTMSQPHASIHRLGAVQEPCS